MIRIALTTTLMAVAALALAACSGGSTTTTTKTVAAPSTRPVSNTGIAPLDQVLDASLKPDSIEMARLTGYAKVACAASADADHPACRDDEQPDTEVEVLPKLGCTDTGFVRPEDVPEAYAAAVGKSPQLTAIYQPVDGTAKWGENYVAVFTTGKHEGGSTAGAALHLHDGRIVAIEDDCNDLLHLLDQSRVGTWVLQPGSSVAVPTGTP
ncbi:MAG TPA: hypothetical protein VFY79_05095 [Dehalococcoidia bacterium]|nr:hypothetical protein [Dehalococcoidia bacterium]